MSLCRKYYITLYIITHGCFNPTKRRPPDIKKIIVKIQIDIKQKKNVGKYSQEKVIYQIIRDYEGLISTLKQLKDSKQAS